MIAGVPRLRRRRPPPGSAGPLDGVAPALARAYAARGIQHKADLEYGLDRLPGPDGLKGMDTAVDLLQVALATQQRILIVADFDADGATSCALGVRALRALGARHVDYLVPNRFEYGYGLTPEIVMLAARREAQLLVTVDNGISSIEGVAAARARGMAVLITDHHLPGAVLPAADAIVNPNQPGDGFISRHLAGVGVMFYVLLALRARLRQGAWFDARRPEPRLADYLDLVALGTVADVAVLDQTNRILIAQGLARINRGRGQAGVRALLEIGGRRIGDIVASDLGFAAGPRLNAAGRLDDMGRGIECLLCDEREAAWALAAQLDDLNRQRREIEQGMNDQARVLVAQCRPDDTGAGLPRGMCLYRADWHQGVVGLVAARMREITGRPVVAFAPSGREELKGSGRSIPGLHLRDTLEAIAARQPGLLDKFGGHAMAAGLSLNISQLESFRVAFDEEVGRRVSDEDLRGQLLSDGQLSSAELGLELAQAIRDGGPWGQGFSEPLFDGIFEVCEERVIGKGRHLKLWVRPDGARRPVEAIAFRYERWAWQPGTPRIRLAYRLDVNEYQGLRRVQLVIEHLECCE